MEDNDDIERNSFDVVMEFCWKREQRNGGGSYGGRRKRELCFTHVASLYAGRKLVDSKKLMSERKERIVRKLSMSKQKGTVSNIFVEELALGRNLKVYSDSR